ncbi:MAG: methylated-DNA--[protein]-cysteine S-methyltransferase [Thermodesulfobacteriota bacterium]
MTVSSALLPSPLGALIIAATRDGVCGITFEDDEGRFAGKAEWRGRQKGVTLTYLDVSGLSPLSEEQRVLKEAAGALKGYFSGSPEPFTLPLVPSSTPFQRSVWSLIMTIPYGETRSYRWVAERLGMRGGARAVGGACGSNPIPIIIPCHRVIASDGAIGGYSGGGRGEGISIKRRLLALEGVTV